MICLSVISISSRRITGLQWDDQPAKLVSPLAGLSVTAAHASSHSFCAWWEQKAFVQLLLLCHYLFMRHAIIFKGQRLRHEATATQNLESSA